MIAYFVIKVIIIHSGIDFPKRNIMIALQDRRISLINDAIRASGLVSLMISQEIEDVEYKALFLQAFYIFRKIIIVIIKNQIYRNMQIYVQSVHYEKRHFSMKLLHTGNII